ncbi:MAG: hypothetical protein IH600_03295 [Bacteroidetes bacterium]|nr:hypothetical protein [Bacteroidota bacterium]
MDDTPLYTSPCTAKSLWQEYRIYSDRIEFATLLGNMVVPFTDIESAALAGSDVDALFHGDLRLKNFRPALKLDWANFTDHIVLDKSTGYIHRILFTPENPAVFLEQLRGAMAARASDHSE